MSGVITVKGKRTLVRAFLLVQNVDVAQKVLKMEQNSFVLLVMASMKVVRLCGLVKQQNCKGFGVV